MALGTDYNDEIGGLAPVPAGPEPGSVGEAEGHAVVKRKYLESPLSDGFEKGLLE